MKYSIWKVPANITTFSYAPIGREIYYEISTAADSVSFSQEEKVLVLFQQPKQMINIGITIVDANEGKYKFKKDFEIAQGVPLSDLPVDLRSKIDSMEREYLQLTEAEYYLICSLIFKLDTDVVLEPEDETQNDVQDERQIIFFGAPGTGKSNKILRETKDKEVFRTTFHPDSDYSTFVGCYKPTMKRSERVLTVPELVIKLKEIKTAGVTYPCQKFGAKYWCSLKDLSQTDIKNILVGCGFSDNMNVEISKGIAVGQEYLNNSEDGKIVYTFIPQSFTLAYVKAWSTDAPVFLVIEEINRGNCAQIFGDLFQLLDRKNGVSEYPIRADKDLAIYLGEELSKTNRNDVPEKIKTGEELQLPSNLYIWATMNTSDQSLFPIDSAFKRRWDWKYVPISDGRKNWQIKIGLHLFDWWGFLNKINKLIGETTNREDKKLGYYFCQGKNGIINADVFVGKVVFYLWNDVFKDYELEGSIFSDENGNRLTFDKFYRANASGDASVIDDYVIHFLRNLDKAIDKDNSFEITVQNSVNDSELISSEMSQSVDSQV